jgi:hypothetical protein
VIWRRRLSYWIPMLKPRRRAARFMGIAACQQVLAKASGDEQFAVEQTEPEFEEVEAEIVARTQEIARWRETGEIAYERDFAVRLTLDDERIVRIVVMPGARRLRRATAGLRAGEAHRWRGWGHCEAARGAGAALTGAQLTRRPARSFA